MFLPLQVSQDILFNAKKQGYMRTAPGFPVWSISQSRSCSGQLPCSTAVQAVLACLELLRWIKRRIKVWWLVLEPRKSSCKFKSVPELLRVFFFFCGLIMKKHLRKNIYTKGCASAELLPQKRKKKHGVLGNFHNFLAILPTGFEDLYSIPTYLFANNFWEGQRQILFHYSNCSHSQSKKFSKRLSVSTINSAPDTVAAWKTTAAKQHRICRSLWFLQLPHCNAETISLQFSIYSRECSPWSPSQNPSKGQGLSVWVYRGVGRFFSFLFLKLFGRFVYTRMETWPARQNQETAKIGVISAVKKIKRKAI